MAKGGNFLLNIGPQPDGEMPAMALSRLKELGDWMKINGEAIYSSRPIPPYKDGQIAFTSRGETAYAIYLTEEEQDVFPEKISFSGLRPEPGSSIHILGAADDLQWQTDDSGNTVVEIPESIVQSPPCNHAFALRFSLLKN